MAIRPLGFLPALLAWMREFQAEMIRLAIGAIDSRVCKRGCRSHSEAISVAEEGMSERPWMVTRMPAMVKVWEEMAKSGGAFVVWRGLVVAAMVG